MPQATASTALNARSFGCMPRVPRFGLGEGRRARQRGEAEAPPQPEEPNCAPDLTREYETPEITVQWFASRCIRSANCVRALHQLFDPQRRPWVDPTAAPANAIVAAILRCPTGALHFVRHDGSAQEVPDVPTTLTPIRNGPLYARGDIEVRALSGELLRRAPTEASTVRRGHCRRVLTFAERRQLGNNPATVTVTNVEELVAAVDRGEPHITVQDEIRGMPMLTLKPGQTLNGGVLHFGSSGVRLTRDNTLADIAIRTSAFERAVLNDTHVPAMGTLTLRNVRTVGQVMLLVADEVRAGHVQVEKLHVERADLRGRIERPRGFGVDAMQGAFTLWNTHLDEVRITAELLDISVGSADAPARGSGVFVGGQGDDQGNWKGGRVDVSRLTTGEIHTDGGIADGTPDLISGGVFVITGAFVQSVENKAPVVTYGQNDMVLDNWGTVHEWTALAPITSRGPSGIGMVQFGRLDALRVDAPIETFGRGARGFNLYAGTMEEARFESIRTHADGAVGIQVSRELPKLSVAGDVTTVGGEGDSLVKGKVLKLKASALSVKAGGEVGQLNVGGSLRTTGDNVVTVEVEGRIGDIAVAGGIRAEGRHSDAVSISGGEVDLGTVDVEARNGERVTRAGERPATANRAGSP